MRRPRWVPGQGLEGAERLARAKILSRSRTRNAVGSSPTSRLTMPPNRRIWRGDGVVRVPVQARVEEAFHRLVALQPLRHLHCVLVLSIDAQAERLDAAWQQPAVERRRHRTDGVLVEPQLLFELGVAAHQRAGDDVAAPADVHGRAMHHDVRAEVQRLLEVWRGEGVVDADDSAMCARSRSRRPCRPLTGSDWRVTRTTQFASAGSWTLRPRRRPQR
jgi:hypothetical protein